MAAIAAICYITSQVLSSWSISNWTKQNDQWPYNFPIMERPAQRQAKGYSNSTAKIVSQLGFLHDRPLPCHQPAQSDHDVCINSAKNSKFNPKKILPPALLTFDNTFCSWCTCLSMNDIVSPPQGKIFIIGVIKVQNQAIWMILNITILKVLPEDKKEGGCRVHSRGGGECWFQPPEGGAPPPTPLSTCGQKFSIT